MLARQVPLAQRAGSRRQVRRTALPFVRVRTDPTDTGGLFVGRRPGTAPIRYRTPPEHVSARRRRLDALVAAAVLAAMVVVNLLFWGPIPALGLWIASRVQYGTGSVSLGILVGFLSLLALLFGGLAVLKRMDRFWILARRAAGHDQRQGMLSRVFATTAVIGGSAFVFWLVFIGGLGSSLQSGH
jgi:hypothetical protein